MISTNIIDTINMIKSMFSSFIIIITEHLSRFIHIIVTEPLVTNPITFSILCVVYIYFSTYVHEIGHVKAIIKYSKQCKSFDFESLTLKANFTNKLFTSGTTNSNFLDHLAINNYSPYHQEFISLIAIAGIKFETVFNLIYLLISFFLGIIFSNSSNICHFFVCLLFVYFIYRYISFFKKDSDIKIFMHTAEFKNDKNNKNGKLIYSYPKPLK